MGNGELKSNNSIVDKSFLFAIRVVRLYRYLCNEKKEYILFKQLLRSGTSIGANVNEAQETQSKNDLTELIKLLVSIIKTTKENNATRP